MLALSSPSSSSSTTTTTSSSDSRSSSSSPSSSSSFSLLPNTTHKTMEEVWKDITVNSLPNTPIHHHIHNHNHNHNHTIHHPTPTSNFRGMILQDFLNRSSMDSSPPPPPPHHHNPSSSSSSSQIRHTPTTEFQFFQNEMMMNNPHSQRLNCSSVPSLIDGVAAFDALASSSVLSSFGRGGSGGVSVGGVARNNKRFCDGDEEDVGVDRRHKRMIKNRESAARSRARKQAYITELELEVHHLVEENAMLRKQQRQLMEDNSAQLPKKHGLYRTLTAPF